VQSPERLPAGIWVLVGGAFLVAVGYGMVAVVDVVVSSSSGPSTPVVGGGPDTTGLSWLVCTRGTV